LLLVDANVLLNAVNSRSRQHDEAHRWLSEALAGREVVAFPWVVQLAFLRLATNSQAFRKPLSVAEAAAIVTSWMSSRSAVVIEPTTRHLPLLGGLLAGSGTAGNLVTDAHLAALALEHDATVVSFDRDFGRFEGVRWRLPA
jgi:toxin-antitoxin system PIN domain toxin